MRYDRRTGLSLLQTEHICHYLLLNYSEWLILKLSKWRFQHYQIETPDSVATTIYQWNPERKHKCRISSQFGDIKTRYEIAANMKLYIYINGTYTMVK